MLGWRDGAAEAAVDGPCVWGTDALGWRDGAAQAAVDGGSLGRDEGPRECQREGCPLGAPLMAHDGNVVGTAEMRLG